MLLKLGKDHLNAIGRLFKRKISFDSNEIKSIDDLVYILEPFCEVTDITQGELYSTISKVLPSIGGLMTHLDQCNENTRNFGPFITKLKESLRKRFKGIISRIKQPNQTVDSSEEFSSDLYVIASILDPSVKLN